MKKVFKVAFVGLLSFVFWGCKSTQSWMIQEKRNEMLFGYELVQVPKEYSDIEKKIFTYIDYKFPSEWISVSNEERILECLKKKNFEIRTGYDGKKYIVLFPTSLSATFLQEELLYVWEILSNNYADFGEMERKGFSKEKLLKIKNEKDFYKYFDKWINDRHFSIRIKNFYYTQPTSRDEGSFLSRDTSNIYFEKETSNAYYIRFNDCWSHDYYAKLPIAGVDASKKDFIILDARSNFGGDNGPIFSFRKYLQNIQYSGTVVILQDNYSFSSGELWHAFGTKDLNYKCLLVGTHSGGMQRLCNTTYENKNLDIVIVAGKYYMNSLLPENYLGEGKGYKPDIWATTATMKETLENLGVDLEGITFR
ncbi:MAG: hypothetical protein IJ293_04980 [Treponema sp.]|nr:hypothetical protein [Treponema sp.]